MRVAIPILECFTVDPIQGPAEEIMPGPMNVAGQASHIQEHSLPRAETYTMNCTSDLTSATLRVIDC